MSVCLSYCPPIDSDHENFRIKKKKKKIVMYLSKKSLLSMEINYISIQQVTDYRTMIIINHRDFFYIT